MMLNEGAREFDASGTLNSTEVEENELGFTCYIEDNFEFLDQIDYNAPYKVIAGDGSNISPNCVWNLKKLSSHTLSLFAC